MAAEAKTGLFRLSFTVHGKVQRVFFRKHTQEKALELRLVGWCKNTPEGTVVGEAEGEEKPLQAFKEWLSKVGSPMSRIDKADFKESPIPSLSFRDFDIVRKPKA